MHRPIATVLARSLSAVSALCAPAFAQSVATWEAASGRLPNEVLPHWDASAPTVLPPSCAAPQALLAGGALTLDTAGCSEAILSYSLYSEFALGAYVEAELQILSSLQASPNVGAAMLGAMTSGTCGWTLHVDAGELFLESSGVRTVSIALDTTSQPRTYRLDIDGATRVARASVDGLHVLTSPFAAQLCPFPGPPFALATFGDYSGDEGGVVAWRRVETDSAPGEQIYCLGSTQPNSLGRIPVTLSNGARSVALNALVLTTNGVPPGSYGYYLTSRASALAMPAAGSQGNLCLGGALGRLNRPGEVLQASAFQVVSLPLDLLALPQPLGPVAALPGDSWHFQFWYRDANPGPTSNLSAALWVSLES